MTKRLDEEVQQRLEFFRIELKKEHKDSSYNSVMRKLLVEAGWLVEWEKVNEG